MSTDREPAPAAERSALRRWSIRMLVAVVLTTWAVAVALLALAVRSAPQRSAIDTRLAGVDQPEEAIDPSASDPTPGVSASEDEQPCWPVYGRRPSRTSDASDLAHGVPRRRTWSMRVGIMEFPPSYCDGVLYVNNQKGETIAIEARTRRIVWRRRTARIYDSTPAIEGKRLFVGAFDPPSVIALERATGKQLWKLEAGGAVESSPIVVDGTVFATSKDRRVYAIHARSGRVKWAYRTGGEVKDSPSYANGLVYVGNYAAEVFALRARDGGVAWRASVGGVRGDRIYASIPVADGIAYAATVRGDLYAFDARTGRTRWHTSIPGYVYSTPAVSGGRLFVANYAGEAYAFNAKTGRRMWKRTLGGTFSGSPTVIGSLVYVSSLSRQHTWALAVKDGRTRWEHDDGRYVTGIASSRALYLSMGSRISRWETRSP